jgi:cell division protein FtsW (lipid II flippase)
VDYRMQEIYNKTISIVALICIIGFLLLSLRDGHFSPVVLYGTLAFILIMFVGFFLTSAVFSGQDSSFIILSCFISGLGLVMLYRINPDLYLKQISWFGIGVILFILSTLATRYWINLKIDPVYYYTVTLVLLALPIIFGVERGGSKNWIQLFGFTFQPSELAKILFGLFLGGSLKDGHVNNFLFFSIQVITTTGLMVLAKDLGGALLFFLTALVILFVSTSRYDFTAIWGVLLIAASLIGYWLFPHVRVRVEAWLNPWQDVPGKGYQIVQSLLAMAQGGYFGTGLGLGYPEYIPAVATDFIFSAFSEEFGFLGASAIIVTYFLLVYRGIRVSLAASRNQLKLIALAITTMFGFQIFTIIGGVIKLIPVTGVTLPFMSYGGSSMVMSFVSLGILNGICIMSIGDGEDEQAR